MEVAELEVREIRTANEWISEAKKRPIPNALFGEFWREGETSVLFSETGKGKSALAMQVAESIASGKWIKPFKAAVKPQNVLYIDLEMNDKQFEARYAADHDGGRAKFLRNHFVFSENLHREELDPADFWVKGESTGDVFRRRLRYLIKQCDASVVIIDSLTCLKRSYYGARELLDLITAVKKLQREMKISVLALIQTPTQADAQPLSLNSLRGMKLLCGRADSMFGIGQSRFDPAERYFKRVKSVGDVIDFDGMHVPTFRLTKTGGNCLAFEFKGFMPEIELLSDIRASKEWNTIERIKEMSDGGMSIRLIAAEINLPKTTVHRLLQMWRPPVQRAANADLAKDFDPKNNPFYFPGREEYDEAAQDPKFNCLYEDESEENYRLRREAYLIEAACAKALQEYKKTGKAPTLAEMLERMSEPPAVAGSLTKISANSNGNVGAGELDTGQPQPPVGAGGTDNDDNPFGIPGLKHRLTNYGKDIWVLEEDYRGKPMKWYNLDSQGRKQMFVRDGVGVSIKQIG